MPKLTAEQQRRVERAAPKVKALARALAPRTPHASVAELESAGYEGLVQAALRFDPTAGVPFRTFAHYRVRGAMIDAARDAAPAIRRRSRAMRALQTTQSLLEQANKRQPRADDPDTRSLKERVAAAAQVVAQATAAVVLSKLPPPDLERVRAPGEEDAETLLAHKQQQAALQRVLDACDETERGMIDALYFRGLSMGEYAKEIGRDKSTVSRHHARLLDRLAKRMRNLRRAPFPPDS